MYEVVIFLNVIIFINFYVFERLLNLKVLNKIFMKNMDFVNDIWN